MKKIITAIGVLLLLTVTVNAQKRKCGNEVRQHKGKGKMIASKLNLTDVQKEKMKVSNTQYKSSIKALQSNDKLTMGEYKAQRAALEAKHKADAKALLTPEQVQQIEKMRADIRQRHTEKAAGKISKLKSTLNLTEAQVATLTENHKKNEIAIAAIKANTALTKEQKKEQMKSIKESSKMNFTNILTNEQKAQWETMKKTKHSKKEISK